MRIAIIENCDYRCIYTGNLSIDDEYNYRLEGHCLYKFYSDCKDISVEQYNVIAEYLCSLKRFYHENILHYNCIEAHKFYDIENSQQLAKSLNCDIFEPGVYHSNIIEHKVDESGGYGLDKTDQIIISVIKYLKLIKMPYDALFYRRSEPDYEAIYGSYWQGLDSWSDIVIDNDNYLCCDNGYNIFRVNAMFADKIYVSSQWESHAIIELDKRWGIVDVNGKILLKPQPYKIRETYSDFCVIESEESSSCMSYDGDILMPFTSQEFCIHYCRYAEINYNNFKLLYDLKFQRLILNACYEYLDKVDKNIIIVRLSNGFVDIYNHYSLKLNSEIVKSAYIEPYTNKIVCNSSNGWFLLDGDGKKIIIDDENRYCYIEIKKDGYICLKQRKPNDYHIYGLADMEGKVIFPCYSDSPIRFFQDNDNSYFILKKYKKQYICNKKGMIISSKYDLIKKGQDGICIAYNGEFSAYDDGTIIYHNGTFYAIDFNGKVIFSMECQDLSSFRNGLSNIMLNYKYGCINKNGEIVIAPMYDSLGGFSCGLIPARKHKMTSWGYIDKFNNIVIPFQYDYAYTFNENGEAYVEIDGYRKRINTKGEYIGDEEQLQNSHHYHYDSIDDDAYIKDGIAEAFNDDPSNYWNID
ncbi:MAG: WG repeat-containing protein [Bacteroidales bacterium]|nr:WG repeat-containing protein [Bacteroidales bacterium]